MIKNVIKLAAGLAWAGVLVSSAAPASAVAMTTQVGSWASCSASYSAYANYGCYDFNSGQYQAFTNYEQNIRFVYVGCSSGGCNSDTGAVYTNQVYATGRKTVWHVMSCDFNFYDLGACAC